MLIEVPKRERSVWVLSAESIAVFKMMFYRPKDIVDLERLLAVRGPALDAAYVRVQLIDMVGGDDERIITWDRLVLDERARTTDS